MATIPRLTKQSVVIVIIDVQEKLMKVMKYREQVSKKIQTLISASEIMNFPIILTEQYSKGLGRTIPEIRDRLPAYSPVEKLTFSCCGKSEFLEILKSTGKKQVLLCGIESHVCVLQTALDLLRDGYEVFVPEDAVCSQRTEDWKAALHRMGHSGIILTSVESAIFEMMKEAGTDEFKSILRVIT